MNFEILESRKREKLLDAKKSKIIALAGNPNVGKSTVFNKLTGMKQHTGNWPGKTVSNARGKYYYKNKEFSLVDIPGTYSLNSTSKEEELARDFICFGKPDCTVVVVDATSLERNLNLVLQILEISSKVVVCVNLLDEAKKQKIEIDLDELSLQLGVPVVGTSARSGKGLEALKETIDAVISGEIKTFKVKTTYNEHIEKAINNLEEILNQIILPQHLDRRWLSLKLLDSDEDFFETITKYLGANILSNTELSNRLNNLKSTDEQFKDGIVSGLFKRSKDICNLCIKSNKYHADSSQRKLDKLLTSKAIGIPFMLVILAFIFWITIVGANYPSEFLAKILFNGEDVISSLLFKIHSPAWLTSMICDGVYKTVAWVVSVMLPPMAIFFPLFTLMEDSGYLPRVAFNLDHFFKKSGAHGKQALTMCMGFGCNACGVMGCRIIDSTRERLIAILTNCFVPCNGKFPTLIAVISIFFVGQLTFPINSLFSCLLLLFTIVICVIMTMLISKILSKTLLKGMPSSFILELPPYRRPQIGKVIVRSIFDKTLFVLGRALIVAAPAGLIIWLMANMQINDISILKHCSNFLDPFAKIMGLDGVILLAFILGFPANEIVIPIILMSYLSTASISEYASLSELGNILTNNGWNLTTAICFMILVLFHFPCGTTCLTVKKETGSIKWTIVSFILPLIVGIILCVVANLIFLGLYYLC